jgi:DNA modification methylase
VTITFMQGDALARLRDLPDGVFQTCVTSPPYFGLRDYGAEGQIGLEDTPDAYVARLVEVFREVRRTLREDGTLWLNLGDSYASDSKWGGSTGGKHVRALHGDAGAGRGKRHTGMKDKDLIGIPWMVAFALRADGWYLRRDVIWAKPNPMPESVQDRPTSSHEYVFLLTKTDRYFYDRGAIMEQAAPESAARYGYDFGGAENEALVDAGARTKPIGARHFNGLRNARSVWTIPTRPFRGAHFAVMTPDLAEKCLRAGASEGGACPHCGTAWTRIWEAREVEPTGAAIGGDPARQDNGTRERDATGRGGNALAATATPTNRFAQACGCPAHRPVRQQVLDPFGGAGTTALIAHRLGMDATLIELNPANVTLARGRIADEAGIFYAERVM